MRILITILTTLSAPVFIQGEYDNLRKKADVLVPPRIKAIRDFLDPGMLEEAAFHILDYYAPTDSDNPLCKNHSSIYQDSFLQDQSWAVRMMDASTKLPNGVLDGNFQDLGSYDECLSIEGPSRMFTGQMCLVQTSGVLPPVIPNPGTSEASLTQALPLDLTLAVCVPSSCSAADVGAHWHSVMTDLNASAAVSSMDCTVRGDTQFGTQSWLALYTLGVFTLLIVASTCFDYYVNHEPTKEQRILLSFSLHASLRKLFHQERRADSLDVLDLLRFLASTWVVLGHRFELNLQVPRLSIIETEKYATAWFMSPFLNFMLSVEIFFIASGCLLSYHFLRQREKGEKFILTDFYFKRLLRVTPAMVFMMMLEGCLLLYVADGPVWKRLAGNRVKSCADYWWSSLLFISNYVNPFNICVLQTWYTAADMQLYLLSPLLLFPLSRSRSKGLLLLALCYAAITAASFFNALLRKLPAGAIVTLDKKAELNYGLEYTKTHLRAVSWVNGLALGYALHLCRDKKHWWIFSKDSSVLLWAVSFALCLAGVFSVHPFQSLEHQYSPLLDSLYIALHRNVFSVGMTGIILLCIFRSEGFIYDVVRWKGFRPLSTLSFGVFLSHMAVQTVQLARIRQPLDFTMFTLIFDFLLDLLLSNMVALFLYVYVEAPFWEIGRWLYNPQKPAAAEKYLPETINIEGEKTTL